MVSDNILVTSSILLLAVAARASTMVLFLLFLRLTGFGRVGIRARSLAARMHRSLRVLVKGGAFSALQSAGARL